MRNFNLPLMLAGALALASCGQQPAPTMTPAQTAAPSTLLQSAALLPGVEHGPTPTATSITQNGTYTVGKMAVSRWTVRGFGGGTLYYPTNGALNERFSGVVTIPGYFESGSVMNLYGTRLASHGFVVLVADVLSIADYPSARARAAQAALTYLQTTAPVQGILDNSRMALIGHSMGGGGVLEAAETADVDAVIAVHPWAQRGFPGVTAPTHVIGGLLDNIAPVSQYTVPLYRSLTSAQPKSLLNSLSGTHWAGTSNDPAIQGRNLAFLKTFVDGDLRYQPFYCAPAAAGTTFTTTAPCF